MDRITNKQDLIDSRDINERIEELQIEIELVDWEKEKLNELNALLDLQENGEMSPDWYYGETLIKESYFTEYCKELCIDVELIPSDLPSFIADNIDWGAVADEMKVDYLELYFDNVTYFIRA